MTWRLGSLFTGTTALDTAAAAVLGDVEPVWHSDIKPAARVFLAHRFPNVPNLGDMTAVAWSTVPPIDVLTAGWPCSPHSPAGKRLGEKDPRALWPNVARAVAELRPTIFLGENVARITSNGELRRVVRTFADLGYVGAWRCVRASDVGAPHRRDRCFVAAVDPAAFAGHAERQRLDHHGQLNAAVTAQPARGGRDVAAPLTLLPTPSASSYGTNQGGAAGRTGPVRESLDTMARNGRFGGQLLPTPTQSMTTGAGTSGRDGGLNLQTAAVALHEQPARWGVYAAAVQRWGRVFGRPAPPPTQPSLRTGKPQLAPPLVEWMMGLPQGWVCDVPDLADRPSGHRNAALSLLGDGVVPQQAAYAYRFLLGHLSGRLTGERAA